MYLAAHGQSNGGDANGLSVSGATSNSGVVLPCKMFTLAAFIISVVAARAASTPEEAAGHIGESETVCGLF
jgi:hypothetical protein